MFICAAGDIHGAMDRLYTDVLAFEESLGSPWPQNMRDLRGALVTLCEGA